ncbi:hypothetical protein BDZ94DRAFT_1267347 [Collybia nuda]|uniref:Uncharacterized protein n=1 Tax=Collybia nuda TaxID=64659 RepID=A0A9P5XZY5_9AGAR|nr:hypothetical protein BDZ94DRAFT_1267347 [Collybia nuda]
MDVEPPNVYRLGYRRCDEISSVTRGVLGKIFSPASLEFPKCDFPVDVKKAILNEFHLIIFSLRYASETLRVPSPSSNGEVITLGDAFETEPCNILNEVRETQHKTSLGPASHLGRIVFARNIRPSPRYVPPGVQWSHPGARFKDFGEMRRFTITRFRGTDRPEIACSCSIQIMDIDARGSAWLAQIHSMHSKILHYMSNPKATISMTTDATFSFSYQSSFDKQNRQPETKRVNLFVGYLGRTANGSISPPEMYWSLDDGCLPFGRGHSLPPGPGIAESRDDR